MKTTIIPIFFLFLIATALAEPILTPTHFNFSVYPGEMKQLNITIESESNYTINFNSSNHYIEIRPKSTNILNGTTNLTLNLTFAGDIPIGDINFIIGENITTPKSFFTSGDGVGHTTP